MSGSPLPQSLSITAEMRAQGNGRTWSTGRELLVIFAFWTFMAVLTSANALLDPRGRGLVPVLPSAPIALAFAESYLWALLTPLIFWLSRRFPFDRAQWFSRFMIFIAGGALVAIAMDATVAYLRFSVFFTPRFPPPRDPLIVASITRFWWLNDLVIYIAVLSAGFARDYFLRYSARAAETVRLQAESAHLQAQLAEVRLATLRSQLDPHFLFNTLNAVSSLVERDPKGVRKMIAKLSELLRYSLEGSGEHEVPLQEELDILERYLDIMRIRFQGNLEATTDVDPAVLDALVPNLILQPLVENALKHGIGHVSSDGRIVVSARREGEMVVLTVEDNGPGLAGNAEGAESSGVGLRNTKARLAALYGEDQSFSLRATDTRGMVAEVRLPYHTKADLYTPLIPATEG